MMIRYLYAACAVAVLALPAAGTSYAGSAESESFVATFGYADVDYRSSGLVREETAITGGLSFSEAEANTSGPADPNNAASANTSAGFSSTATANGTSDSSNNVSSNHNGSNGCGCDGASSHSEGGTSASASAGAGAN